VQVESTDGVSVALHDMGGSGPPLLIAHATGFLAAPYQPLADALAGDFHVFGIDFRAHGDSTRPASGDLAWSGGGDDVLAVVDAIGGPVTGFGHSYGGAALLIAERVRPGTVRAAFLYEPIVPPSPLPETFGQADNPLAASARRRRPTFPSRAEALARYASRPPLGRLRADALHAYVQEGFTDLPDGTVTLKCRPEDEAGTFEAAGFLTTADLGGLTLPVTVAKGARDDAGNMGPPRFVPAIVEALPNAEQITYDHLDHFGPFEDPDTIAEDVIRRTRA
jgi:pimeloyl-ACP methyl ester carboxylesterase